MGLIIGENESNTLDFEGKGLTSKSVRAVADAVSKYKLKIEHVNYANNQLKDIDCKIIIDALQNQYKNLISLSFRGNKIGSAGVTALLNAYEKATKLESIDLSENIVSDEAAMRLFEKIEKSGSKLKNLSLARNFIGKTVHAQGMVNQFVIYLASPNCNLETLDMSWNNIGGRIGKAMFQALGGCHTLKEIKFAYNLLGVATNVKGKLEEPAILELCEVFLKSQGLEEVDISFNSIDSFATYVISYGLERSMSMKTINLTGNPIGSTGVKYLVNAVHESANKQFINFIVDDSLALTSSSSTGIGLNSFEVNFVEGDYAFDISKAFDRFKLRKLLDLVTTITKEITTTTVEQCLLRPRLDAKAWTIPKCEATMSYSFPIDAQKGIIRMTLSLKHLKANLAGVPTNEFIEKVKKTGGSSGEKKTVRDNDFDNICKLLIEYRNNDKEESQVEMLIGLAQDNKFWTYQAKDVVMSLKNVTSIEKIMAFLMTSVIDRLLLHTIFEGLSKSTIENILSKQQILTDFTPLNVNGHYILDLTKPFELSIATELVQLNTRTIKLIEKNKLFDRSKNGNKSCFRNETLQYNPINIIADWKIPKTGILEFDFIYLYQSREKTAIANELFEKIFAIFKNSQITISEKIRMFKVISEYIWITTDQLKQLLELHEDAIYKRDMYIYGIGRVTDFENYDFIKAIVKPDEKKALKDLYKSVGILNLFNPYRPDGEYTFDLKIYEERIMMNILCEMAKKEGITCVTKIIQDEKEVKEIDAFIKAPPKEGNIEMIYVCPDESKKLEMRKAIGDKYLSWKSKIDFSLITSSPAKK